MKTLSEIEAHIQPQLPPLSKDDLTTEEVALRNIFTLFIGSTSSEHFVERIEGLIRRTTHRIQEIGEAPRLSALLPLYRSFLTWCEAHDVGD